MTVLSKRLWLQRAASGPCEMRRCEHRDDRCVIRNLRNRLLVLSTGSRRAFGSMVDGDVDGEAQNVDSCAMPTTYVPRNDHSYISHAYECLSTPSTGRTQPADGFHCSANIESNTARFSRPRHVTSNERDTRRHTPRAPRFAMLEFCVFVWR